MLSSAPLYARSSYRAPAQAFRFRDRPLLRRLHRTTGRVAPLVGTFLEEKSPRLNGSRKLAPRSHPCVAPPRLLHSRTCECGLRPFSHSLGTEPTWPSCASASQVALPVQHRDLCRLRGTRAVLRESACHVQTASLPWGTHGELVGPTARTNGFRL